MVYASAGGVGEMVITIAAFAVLCVITYAFFVFGQNLVRFLST